MAIPWNTIKPALIRWFSDGSGIDASRIVWANQTSVRLATPFAEINYRMAIARQGAYDEERIDPSVDGGQINRVAQRLLTVSCHTYGPGAIDAMERAQEYLGTFAARAVLDAAGLFTSDRGKVTDLTALLETAYEERAQLDVIFALAVTTPETVGEIDSFGVGVTLKNPDGTTAGTFTLP